MYQNAVVLKRFNSNRTHSRISDKNTHSNANILAFECVFSYDYAFVSQGEGRWQIGNRSDRIDRHTNGTGSTSTGAPKVDSALNR